MSQKVKKKRTLSADKEQFLRAECVCCGNCCRQPIVPVNDSDVLRLHKGTGKKIESFVSMYAGTQVELEPDGDYVIHFAHGSRVMGLRRKDGKCVFQDDNNRCSVYEHRPVTCRTFPLAVFLDAKGSIRCLSFIGDITCQRKTGKKRDLKEIRELARWEDAEDRKYYRKVRKWNKAGLPGGKKAFLEFLFGDTAKQGKH